MLITLHQPPPPCISRPPSSSPSSPHPSPSRPPTQPARSNEASSLSRTTPSSKSRAAKPATPSPRSTPSSPYAPQHNTTSLSPTTNILQIDQTNLAGVDAQDLAILKAARETAEDAEVGTGGFNEAIDAAGGKNTAAGKALQNGKIKNKVLKLQLEVLALKIDGAKGKDTTAKVAEETKKLNNNIALDKAAAGQASTPVNFKGTSQP